MRHPTILNLHLRSWDSHIADLDARPPSAAEGRRAVADTHLALLGVKIVGNGILGITKELGKYERIWKYRRSFEDTKAFTRHRRSVVKYKRSIAGTEESQ